MAGVVVLLWCCTILAKTVTSEIVKLNHKQYLYVLKITGKLLRDLLIRKTIGHAVNTVDTGVHLHLVYLFSCLSLSLHISVSLFTCLSLEVEVARHQQDEDIH